MLTVVIWNDVILSVMFHCFYHAECRVFISIIIILLNCFYCYYYYAESQYAERRGAR
jgi:hypothetical protein